MKNFNEIEKRKTPEQEKLEDITDYVRENKISGTELRIAHEIALGISPEESGRTEEIRQEVRDLGDKIEEHTKNGLPINLVAEFMLKVEEYDLADQSYFNLVDDLPITDKEKKILYSVVTDKRVGIITFWDRHANSVVASIEIPQEAEREEVLPKDIAMDLIKIIQRLKGYKKLEVEFIS